MESLEGRMLMSSDTRSISEIGNNAANKTWGTANIDLIRLAKAAYGNGLNSPSLAGDQSARTISNLLNNQADPANPAADIATIDQNSLSDFGYAFGQFMDHDLDLTPDGGESFPITVPTGDRIGPNSIPFTRSQFDPATGTTNDRQQVTTTTAFLDLSNVYGSTDAISQSLRTLSGGLLKTSPGNMLPYDSPDYFNADQIAALNMANDAGMVSTDKLFAAGDRRANENVELTALQTLFMRNHNRIAAQLQTLHPAWTDDMLFREARKINIAQYQSIVYNEWIPAVLGQNALRPYRGYNAWVDPSISNEFSTVAFRFGHSLLSAEIERHNNDGTDAGLGDVSLAEDFFDPNLLNPNGVLDPITQTTSSDIGVLLKAEADGNSQAMDLLAVGDIRNLLFGNGAGGDDLMARDVQRGRDHGIPDYNTLRVALGLPAVKSFSQITRDTTVQDELAAAYGNVNNIDAFEGGLAEDHVRGSDVGPLFQAIMVDQFTRLRDGDRFFYLNQNFTTEEAGIFFGANTLTKAIEANSTATNLQTNAFKFRASISGTVSLSGASIGRNPWQWRSLPRITVQLENSAGDLVATTFTDYAGNYSFNQLSTGTTNVETTPGVSATGTYQIVLVLPSTLQQVTAPAPVTITAGDTMLNGVNFTVASTVTNPPVITPPSSPDPHSRPYPGHWFFGDNSSSAAATVTPVVMTSLTTSTDNLQPIADPNSLQPLQ